MMTTLAAAAISFGAMSVFVLFFAYSYRIGMGRVDCPLADRANRWIFLVGSLIGLFLCWYVVRQDRFVFYWDYGSYWAMSYTNMEHLFAEPLQTMRDVCRSINVADYNLLLPLLVALPLKIFGCTFPAYVMINAVVFLLPVLFLSASIGWKLVGSREERSPRLFFLLVVLAVTFHAFYGALISGYIDEAGMIPAALAVLMAIDFEPGVFDRTQVRRDVLIALLLLCAFLMRRYFANFIVGYIAALIICSLPVLRSRWQRGWREALRPVLGNFLVIGGTAAAILLIFCWKLVKRILSTSYAQQYAGYDLPFWDKVFQVLGYFGGLVVALAVLGIVFSVAMGWRRKMACFLFVSIIVTLGCFFKVQSVGIHHIYAVCVPMFLLFFMGCTQMLRHLRQQRLAEVLLCVLLLAGTLHTYQMTMRNMAAPISLLYPTQPFRPMQRSDIGELQALAGYLNEQADPEAIKIYVLASGSRLNSDILDSLGKPYDKKPVHQLLRTHDVDLRDGFPTDFLRAGIIVTTDPTDLHMAPGMQEVVSHLAEAVKDPASPLGRHFEKDAQEFTLDGGMHVLIYRKVSDFTQEDLQLLAEYFTNRYPGQEKIFADRILSGKE